MGFAEIQSGQSESGNDSNEEVLCIPQSSSITEASLSDCLVSYQGHSLGKSYYYGSVRGVMVIVVGNGHGATSSNPGRDRLHFT